MKYRATGLIGVAALTGVIFFVVGLVLTAAGAPFLGLVLVLYASAQLGLGGLGWRPLIEVTETDVLVARGRRKVRIPLTEVSGVGLLYTLHARTHGWFLNLWTHDGKRQETAVMCSGSRTRDDLASTRVGRITRDLYERVIAVQGDGGYLAAEQRQKHMTAVTWTERTMTDYWSPDEERGRITSAAPPGIDWDDD